MERMTGKKLQPKIYENLNALDLFVKELDEGKLIYDNGKLYRHWNGISGWLDIPVRAEKDMSNGYYMIRANREGLSYNIMAHRVIYKFFNKNVDISTLEINHKNGNKKDNRIENLELVISSENQQHAVDNGLVTFNKGDEHHATTISNFDVLNIRYQIAKSNITSSILADIYGTSDVQIRRIKTGDRRETVGGPIFPSDTIPNSIEIESFKEYSEQARTTAAYPANMGIVYCSLGLTDELVELYDKINLFNSVELAERTINFYDIAHEAVDSLWYISNLSIELNINNKITFKQIDIQTQYNPDDLYNHSIQSIIMSGKICGIIKKMIRDTKGKLPKKKEVVIISYLQTILHHIQNILAILGYKIEYMSQRNLDKLFSRQERGVIQGSGDNR